MMASSGTVRPIAACRTLPVRSTRSLADLAKLVDAVAEFLLSGFFRDPRRHPCHMTGAI
jgi:hypothetical protein